MNFSNASVIESLTWTMRLADFPRAQNRALINALFDGSPPYTPEEEATNNIAVNVNFLESTKLGHDARQQFTNAFQKPGNFFTARTDMGTRHKREERGVIVSREVNRLMKGCPIYYETMRSKFALLVLHGIAPSHWETRDYWCPDALGVEDVMIPSGTLLNLKNLPFFAIYRAYTAEELYRLTHGPKRDPAWQMDTVRAAIKWADAETATLSGTTWPEVWSPDKMEQRMKEDSGLYASDAVPVISAWDFYWWNDSKKVQGWNRRIVLDAFGQPGVGGVIPNSSARAPSKGGAVPDTNILGGRGQFLYNPGDRKYASNIREILQFQYADLSAVAPFRYHAVRSLGFLLYAVCHLQNRLRCKFNEAVFEGLMMYMRVRSMDEAERALKINLISRGIIDDTVQFLRPEERWQVNEELVQLGLAQNQQIINDNSASFVQSQNYSKPETEKTAFQVRAELNATTALMSAALLQAYQYQKFEYQEIFRRFCNKDSRDPDVRAFRLRCLKRGIPEDMLDPAAWDIEPEQVMGAGNKTLELATIQSLMEWRPLFPPEAQQKILRSAVLGVTDNAAMADELVPQDSNPITDSKHDAMVAMGSLMLGLPVQFTDRSNRMEIIPVLLGEMAMIIKRIQETTGGMANMKDIIGLQTVGQTIGQLIEFVSQDKTAKEQVKQFSDALNQLMNEVKGFEQRLQQAMKKAGANGQQNGEAQAEQAKNQVKLQGMQMQAQVKTDNARTAHAQKTAQRAVQWEAEETRKQQAHEADIAQKQREAELDLAAQKAADELDLAAQKAAAEIELQKQRDKPAPGGGEE